MLHFREDVGAENDGVLARQCVQQIADFDNLLGVEAGGGLVENQHVGIVDDGLRDADALAVAFRKLADQLVAHVAQGAAADHFIDAAS